MLAAPIPESLGPEFSTREARERGVTWGQLRARGLSAPFQGTRMRATDVPGRDTTFAALREYELSLIRALGTRLVDGQFFTHRSAALIWGAPLPHPKRMDLHLGVFRPQRSPRVNGAFGHSFVRGRVDVTTRFGLPVLSPASTFATLGTLPLPDLVAVGDYLVRKFRNGAWRPNVGRPPLSSIGELERVVRTGRWRGIANLREAVTLVREDSWSPRETLIRVLLVQAGLPEPELNVDVFDRHGEFLGCVDMLYRRWRLIIEYQGEHHSATYARDIERIERLRAEGWVVIQVTKTLANQPDRMVERVARELRRAGWRG